MMYVLAVMGYIGDQHFITLKASPMSYLSIEAWRPLWALLVSAKEIYLIALFSKWKINDFDCLLACCGFVFILLGMSDIPF